IDRRKRPRTAITRGTVKPGSRAKRATEAGTEPSPGSHPHQGASFMLTKEDLASQLQDLALSATRLADRLSEEEDEPEPLALAEAVVAVARLAGKLDTVADRLAGANGRPKGKKQRS